MTEIPFSNGYYYPTAARPQVLEALKLKTSGAVLDIGAGFGNNLQPLLKYDFKITATETNPNCLAALKELQQEHPGKITLVDGPLEALNFTAQFDLIICTMVLHFLAPKDAHRAIENMQEWTSPQGINVVTTYTANNTLAPLQEHGVTFFVESDELKSLYAGWDIIPYEETPGTGKNAISMLFESARLIAQKR